MLFLGLMFTRSQKLSEAIEVLRVSIQEEGIDSSIRPWSLGFHILEGYRCPSGTVGSRVRNIFLIFFYYTG